MPERKKKEGRVVDELKALDKLNSLVPGSFHKAEEGVLNVKTKNKNLTE